MAHAFPEAVTGNRPVRSWGWKALLDLDERALADRLEGRLSTGFDIDPNPIVPRRRDQSLETEFHGVSGAQVVR